MLACRQQSCNNKPFVARWQAALPGRAALPCLSRQWGQTRACRGWHSQLCCPGLARWRRCQLASGHQSRGPPAGAANCQVAPTAWRARQSCMAMWASSARAAPAQPARQVLEWNTMPRYLKLTTAARGWPAERRCRAGCSMQICAERLAIGASSLVKDRHAAGKLLLPAAAE